MGGVLASSEIPKTDIIPGFSAHAAEYSLIASFIIGGLGALIAFFRGCASSYNEHMERKIQKAVHLEQCRFNDRIIEQNERHNKTKD